jgi:TonB-dependent receptor
MTRFSQRAFLLATVAGLGLATAAVAQETETEEVVVTGRPIAESEAAALRIQRNSDQLVSVVASDTVGRFPDQNIAFAVGRLPGISIQRDQGQARYVSLRGAPTDWTTLSFDGINVVSPEGRTSRFDNVPSALASQIVARKAVTPDMPGETLAGNINVITRSPFDYPGLKISGKLGAGYVTLGGGEEIDTNLVVSNRFLDGKLGVLVSGSYYKRNMVTDNFETDWEAVSQDTQPGFEDRAWPREIENKLYRLTRYNRSLSGRLEYRPTDEHSLFLSSIYTEYRDDELRVNVRWDVDDRQSGTPTTPCASRPNGGATVSGGNSGYADICAGNTPLQGTVYGIDFANNYNDLESVEFISTHTLGGDHTFGEWDFAWRANYTQTEDGGDAPALIGYDSPSSRTARPSITYDLTDRDRQIVGLFTTVQNPDGSFALGQRVRDIELFDVPLTSLRRRFGGAETNAYLLRADASRGIALFGLPVDVKLGVEWADRTKKDQDSLFTFRTADIVAAGLPRSLSAIAMDKPYLGDFALGYDFRYHNSARSRALVDQAIATGLQTFVPIFNYKVTEQFAAAYGMGTFNFDWGNIVAGARIERTENTGTAPFTVDDDVRGLSTVSSDDTMVFPSVHLNWNLNDAMKVRFSVNTGAARPDYDDLAPSFEIDDEEQIIVGGNPLATPERAVGFDAYFEWYLQPRGIFSAGVFYKDVSDVLFGSSTRFGLDVVNEPGFDRSDYTFNTLLNGGDGYIAGFEIAYQQQAEALVERLGLPTWLGGFGVQLNATLAESEAETPEGRKVRLPGASDLTYNAIGYYEMFGFSARLAYQKRTEWLNSLGGPERGGDNYWDHDDELDLSIRYQVNDNIEWFFDAANLLDGPGRRYNGTRARVSELEKFGERYIMGVRFDF